ncbi:hypothetical protein [Mesorhizobium helmanticense]|uniref:Uncharacterized protein n=1 Tax=Mesorhizobium helmanticense TaxID=1776423 RepID=A0A2T4J0X3_9HYPH|nr:hypothetical protein [Mesorhizobium helmanticense]PTE11532.1 hypothetical protein C9427_04740 [Mesorhizobium helmanticense]
MPNITVRAAAEGMPAINRRRMLNLAGAGLALAAAGATVRKASAAPIDAAPAGRAKTSPKLRAVIKAHKEALANWDSVCTCCDEVKLGRKATSEERQKHEGASDDEQDAFWKVCRFPARTPADLAAKGRYLRRFHNHSFGYLQEEQVDALLLSMAHARKAAQS